MSQTVFANIPKTAIQCEIFQYTLIRILISGRLYKLCRLVLKVSHLFFFLITPWLTASWPN